MTKTKVVNGKIQYFVDGQRVKPNEYYKFRSEIVGKWGEMVY